MFYANWMSYIKDEAKITRVAMPGSHNSATMGMNKFAKCQNGSLYAQAMHGVRMFDLRFKATKKGELIVAHGLMNGMPAELAFENLQRLLDSTNEFFVIGIRTYMNQGIGPITLHYNSNNEETNRLIRKYLNPEKYALTDFENIAEVTVGDIRKSGKRYILLNENKEYDFSTDAPMYGPWDPVVFGFRTEKFIKEIQKYLLDCDVDGFHWLQTQQTPNPGTENGWTKWPDDLDDCVREVFPELIADIAADPVKLDRVNIIAGDFMARDYFKAKLILRLNLLKGNVKDELIEEFTTFTK